MAVRRPPPPPPPRQPMRSVHRYLGLFGALVLLGFVTTGIALQHPQVLGLDAHFVESPALVRWLGVEAPEPVAFAAGSRRVAHVGERLILDETLLAAQATTLVGAVEAGNLIVAAGADAVLLLDGTGALVERVALPSPAERLGTVAGTVVAATPAGHFALDETLATWQRVEDPGAVAWSEPVALDSGARARLEALYLTRAVTIERAVRALHAGQAFGRYGPYVVDAAALLLLMLAGSGLWLARQR